MKKILLAMLIGIFAQASAYAQEVFQGRIVSIDNSSKEVIFIATENPVYAGRQIPLNFESVVTVVGIAQPQDLKAGDIIKVEVSDSHQPIWKITRLEYLPATRTRGARVKETTSVTVPGDTYKVTYKQDGTEVQNNPKYRMQDHAEIQEISGPSTTSVTQTVRPAPVKK